MRSFRLLTATTIAFLAVADSLRPHMVRGVISAPARAMRPAMLANEDSLDMNVLMTALNVAVSAEDYVEAARIKALISSSANAPISTAWPAALVPPWMLERLEGLGFRYPTPIQVNPEGFTPPSFRPRVGAPLAPQTPIRRAERSNPSGGSLPHYRVSLPERSSFVRRLGLERRLRTWRRCW